MPCAPMKTSGGPLHMREELAVAIGGSVTPLTLTKVCFAGLLA